MVLRKRTWWITLWAVPLLLVAAIIVSQWQVPVQAQNGGTAMDKRTITVSGTGEITVEPDVAYLNLGVLTKGKTAEQAQSENAAIYENLNKVLTEQFKIEAKDIQTVGFNVRPDYSYQEGREPVITGYTATHNIRITYRDLDQIGELLDAATKAGVNQVNHVQFATEKSADYEKEAMKLAMSDAREKAELLAATEGQTVKGAISIVHNGASGGMVIERGLADFSLAQASSAAGTMVNPGEIVIRTSVTVVYEF